MNSKRVQHGRRRVVGGDVVAALDIGSHKVCCLIGAVEPSYTGGQTGRELRVLGIGHQRSQGIVAGSVTDLRLAQSAVAAAVSQAEHAAGVRIEDVVLGAGCGDPRSRTFNGHVDLPDGVVRDADIARLDAGARAFAARDGAVLLSLNRIAFGLDTTPAVREPRGLAGHRLEANHHAVTVAPGPLRNLCLLAESCQLRPVTLYPAGFASALAATTAAERSAGVVCVDLGAGLASIAGFADGHFIFAGAVPLGGQHVTDELAHATVLPLAQAERIKTLYGSLVQSALDEHEVVPLSGASQGGTFGATITRARLGRSVTVAMRQVLARVRACLDGCSIGRIRTATVVLTGGVAETIGIEAFAAVELGRPVRVAGAVRIGGVHGGMAVGASGPAFSSAVGLAMAAVTPAGWITTREDLGAERSGYLGRVQQWLRQSF